MPTNFELFQTVMDPPEFPIEGTKAKKIKGTGAKKFEVSLIKVLLLGFLQADNISHLDSRIAQRISFPLRAELIPQPLKLKTDQSEKITALWLFIRDTTRFVGDNKPKPNYWVGYQESVKTGHRKTTRNHKVRNHDS